MRSQISSRKIRIIMLLVVDTLFFLTELIIGFVANSLALITDSFHLLNDIISLIISLWSIKLVLKKNPSEKYTYGWQRAEVLGALINGIFLIAICLAIFLEAIQRFFEHLEVRDPFLIFIIGVMGIFSNIFGLFLFHNFKHNHKDVKDACTNNQQKSEETVDFSSSIACRKTTRFFNPNSNKHINNTSKYDNNINENAGSFIETSSEKANEEFKDDIDETPVQMLLEHNLHNHAKPKNSPVQYPYNNLNMKGIVLHVFGDALGNIGVIITALFIWLTNFSWRYYADPFVSILVSIIISVNALPLVKSSSLILLQVAPKGIHIEDIKEDISSISDVISIHELHIWQLSDTKLIASAHILVNFSPDNAEKYMNLVASVRHCLHAYGIHSSTIQLEFQGVYPHKAFFTENNNDRKLSCCLLECVGGEECVDNRCCIFPDNKKNFVI
ncbi:hypothetical protein PORY_000049 [Pneumocystis oryctolagi]|uniref:Uncharacterized protein n=1 Tax=Pneumocystis oryctolagi TaxID=42067 RepID=A0ACB7CE58_9ASCO|nr:hypothetical protein PORY_000049 [Pneumocystis oryctolagi]